MPEFATVDNCTPVLKYYCSWLDGELYMTKPFLKWAGGKRWLIESAQIPDFKKFDRYIEPFLGSASVFFHLSPKSAILADANRDLINCYNAIKHQPKLVRRYLSDHRRNHSDSYYYSVRQQTPTSDAARAAKFLYLNRACWNGLYRVNRQGVFNVPRGTKNQIIFRDDDFDAVSMNLQSANIYCADFEQTLAEAGEGDLVFADPPYTVLHNTNGFVKYNEKIFSWDDQLRLRAALMSAATRGAQIFLTNADHESIRALYSRFGEISVLHRHAKLSGKNIGRRPTTELLVRL